MTPEEFNAYLSIALRELGDDLISHAIEFYEKEGRGVFLLQFVQDESGETQLGIGYDSSPKSKPWSYLARAIKEYDPKSELVILARFGDLEIVKHMRFDELLAEDR